MAVGKDLRSLQRRAEKQGWEVELASGGHLRWHPPDGGEYVATSATPSDSNILSTIQKDLVNAGFIPDPQVAKRVNLEVLREGFSIRKLEKAGKMLLGKGYENTSDEEILMVFEQMEPDLYETIRFSSTRKQVLVEIMREWGPKDEFPTTCETCSKEFTDPIGLGMHLRSWPDHKPLFHEWVAVEPKPRPRPKPKKMAKPTKPAPMTVSAPEPEPVSVTWEGDPDAPAIPSEVFEALALLMGDDMIRTSKELFAATDEWIRVTRRLLDVKEAVSV